MADVQISKESHQPKLRGDVPFTKVTGSVKLPDGGGTIPIEEQLTEGVEVPVTTDKDSGK